jgi:hypothetical protein
MYYTEEVAEGSVNSVENVLSLNPLHISTSSEGKVSTAIGL